MAIKPKRVKRTIREKRKLRSRRRLMGSDERPRLCVYRSSKHIYAQLISDQSGRTLASASTLEDEVKKALGGVDVSELSSAARSTKSLAAAQAVGLVVAQRGKQAGVERVVFDRNGFVYHGRVQAVAEGARKGGLQF